jgi:cytochrome c
MIPSVTCLIAATAVPRELALPLPLNSWELEIILVALFLLHILFVNLMVGGSLLTALFEIMGLTWPRYDSLARRIGATITVNKSLAVVLGVGPLLAINLLYTTYFYSANVLTGYAWLGLVPLIILVFLLTYLHKFTWDRWTGPKKRRHIALGIASAVLFLCIPLVFLSNINLMLFPGQWSQVAGFFSSLQIGNVFPRYFHFVMASLAVTGLFLAGWFGRKGFPVEHYLPEFTRPQLRRLFYRVTFYVTLAQVLFGPLLLLTLPVIGVTYTLVIVISIGVIIAATVMVLLWAELRTSDRAIGRYYVPILMIFTLVVVFMATGRHVYREASLTDHRALMANRSDTFRAVNLAAHMRLDAGLGLGEALALGPTGKSVFKNCAACHAYDRVLAGPSITEVQQIYAGDIAGIVAWTRNPGKKRDQFAPMPSFAHLGDEQLQLVAEYILQMGQEKTNAETTPTGS